MVMADQEPPSIDLKQDQSNQGSVPLQEVLGEAEARFGPMPTCIRSILLPPSPPAAAAASITISPPSHPSTTPISSSGDSSRSELHHGCLDPSDRTRDDQERGIGLEDTALVSSPPILNNTITQDDDDVQTPGKSGTIFLELDDDYDERARRSPDSGCSMSEASVEDKISIASTVSASSDDGGLSRLGSQIQRLKQAMSELREQDVALARQLLIVYDFVEETKWFLENFEACDPRHSMNPMSSTERRFSQNFQKRLSDFGIKGIPHSGFATPPSWTELTGGGGAGATTPKRHSRNISDGMISIEHLRRMYHENNNNASMTNLESVDKSELGDESIPDGQLLEGSTLKQKSPKPMTRRSISSNFLEISFNSMTSDHCRHQGPLSPITDSGKTMTMNEGDDDDDDDDDDVHNLHLQSTPLPHTNPLDKTAHTTVVDEKRTNVHQEIVSFYVADEEQTSASPNLTSHHHRGSASSSSASSMMSLQSCSSSTSSSSTDTRSNASQNTTNTTKAINNPPLSVNTSSLEPTADDCSIFIAEDADDHTVEDSRSLMSPFESHMNWLQEQDETLL